jgi:hypothetical protein
MSADHDALIRRAQQLIATKTALVHPLAARLRRLEECLDDTHRRIGRSRDLLATSTALLQQAKIPRP